MRGRSHDSHLLLPLVSVLAAPGDGADSAESQEYPELELLRLEGVAADGAIGSLARGLERAGGEFAIYLAPGDSLLPDAIARLSAALSARPEVGLIYPAFRFVDEHGVELATTVPEELDFTGMLMFQYNPIGPGAMFRRDLGLEAARLDSGPSLFGEFMFWLRVAASGGVCRLIEPLACRRVDAEGRTRSSVDSARERLESLERILSEQELPMGSEAAMRSAARSACVLAAMEFEAGLNAPGERFFVADRFSERGLGEAAGDDDAEVARLEAHIVNVEQRLVRHQAVIPLLESAVAAREGRLEGGGEKSGRSLRRMTKRLLRSGDER